eukprot:jgi/Galph1/2999/GphlegSOOS_G1663.1
MTNLKSSSSTAPQVSQSSLEETTSRPGIRARAATKSVQQASAIISERSKLLRQRRKASTRVELFFAVATAGLAWNLWKTKQDYDQFRDQLELEVARLRQERDSFRHQLSCVKSTLERDLDDVAENLLATSESAERSKWTNNKELREERKEFLLKWLREAFPS